MRWGEVQQYRVQYLVETGQLGNYQMESGMRLDWRYNGVARRWEATTNGWRGMVARWASSAEWSAAIEPLDMSQTQQAAGQVFRWVEDAQGWCEAELARRGVLA